MRRLLTLAVFAAVLTAGSATAASPPSPASDCNLHGALTRRYTVAQLRHGLETMPAYVKEYTDCYDVIQRTMIAQAGGTHTDAGAVGAPGSGGSLIPTPLIVVLVMLAAAASLFGILAVRRRHGGD